MTPDFQILADQQNVTEVIRTRLLSLRVTDEAGIESDTCEIELDDRNGEIEWPRLGANLEISLGYTNQLTPLGSYIVDEVEHSGPPDTMVIRAKATDMRASLKAPKSRSWDQVTIKDVVSTIAADHGYDPRVSDAVAEIPINHIDQTDESDIHLLTRLAKDYGAVSKPAGRFWLFVERGQAKAASGIDLPTVEIQRTSIISHRLTQAERSKYNSVVAYWYDATEARRLPVVAGDGEPSFFLKHDYPDQQRALSAATSKLQDLERGVQNLSLSLIGNTALFAEGRITINGLRSPINDDWVIQRVNHQLSAEGFSTQLDAVTPTV